MNGYKNLDKSRTSTRRKCGWGSVLTSCNNCGRIMMGHNRGLCSKCQRTVGTGRKPSAESVLFSYRTGEKAHRRDNANFIRQFANGGGAR